MVERHRCTLAGGFKKQNNSFYMREIKFRGKRKDNGEWVVGLLVMGVFNDTMIQTKDNGWYNTVVVIHETVGQFTGLKDKSGKEIYEGDYVNICGRVLPVVYMKAGFYTSTIGTSNYRLGNWALEALEVIGNIHDNPELLNPPADSPASNTMYNTDPAAKQPDELKAEQATELESATQDQAMEVDSEEGSVEG